LFGFQYKTATLVEINAALAFAPIPVHTADSAFENVVVIPIV
jgi:hypothetical protein